MKPRITRVPPVVGASSWMAAVDALSKAVNIALSDIADAFEGKGHAHVAAYAEDIFDLDGGFPRYMPNPLTKRACGLSVVYAEDLTTGAAFTAPVFPTWDVAGDGRLVVKALTGLTAGRRYRIRYEVSA